MIKSIHAKLSSFYITVIIPTTSMWTTIMDKVLQARARSLNFSFKMTSSTIFFEIAFSTITRLINLRIRRLLDIGLVQAGEGFVDNLRYDTGPGHLWSDGGKGGLTRREFEYFSHS